MKTVVGWEAVVVYLISSFVFWSISGSVSSVRHPGILALDQNAGCCLIWEAEGSFDCFPSAHCHSNLKELHQATPLVYHASGRHLHKTDRVIWDRQVALLRYVVGEKKEQLIARTMYEWQRLILYFLWKKRTALRTLCSVLLEKWHLDALMVGKP